VEEIRVENAREFFEKVFAELVCLCNLKALVVAEGGVVKLPAKYGGRLIGDVAAELCGPCILVDEAAGAGGGSFERGVESSQPRASMSSESLAAAYSACSKGRVSGTLRRSIM